MNNSINAKLFIRTFFVQSLWNFERLQNIGFLYVLYPVFKKLYPDKNKRKEVLLRHIGFFNTNPYMANIVFAMIINAESEIASGRSKNTKKPEILKSVISGPIAAIGDSFFWGTWRPVTSFVAILLSILAINMFDADYLWVAPIAFIFLYNIVHILFRYWILFISFRLNEQMIKLVAKFELTYIGDIVRLIGLAAIVATLYFYFDLFGFSPAVNIGVYDYSIPEIGIFGIILLFSFLFGKMRPVIMFYCAILFSFVIGYLGL